jgi:hypothetical protein
MSLRKVRPLPSQAELLESFEYNPILGTLTWKTCYGGRVSPGRVAGCQKIAGHYTGFKGHKYKTSRLIWKMLYNEEHPIIDHKDLDNSNNALTNLRPATHSQNGANRKVRPDNALGVKGVYKNGIYFVAQIRFKGKKQITRKFRTLEPAKKFYQENYKKLHGDYGRPE